MIRRLRRRHRTIIVGLCLLVPPAYALSLATRHPEALTTRLPLALSDPAAPPWQVLAVRQVLVGKIVLSTRLLADSASPRHLVLELAPVTDPREPDPLVYWSPDPAPSQGGLPAGAFLLGHLAGTRIRSFALPADAVGREGRVVLYSLGHQRLIGEFALATTSLLGTGP